MQFELQILHKTDGVTRLSLEATDPSDATRQAEARGLSVLSVRRQAAWRLGVLRTRTRFALTLFSQELLALLDAGLSLVECLETLADKEQQPDIKQTLQRVNAQLYEGHPLSRALQQFPGYFPPLYIATVRASEKTGDLSTALGRFVAYQEQMDVVRKKIISASIYPVILLVAGLLVTLFLIGYVVPKFSMVYDQMGRNLPLFSRLLMDLGHSLRDHSLIIFLLTSALFAALGYAGSRPALRQKFVQRLWQIPALGERMKTYQLARFYRTLGMLLQGGTPIVTALHMTADLLPGSLRPRLEEAALAIREGLSISKAMERHDLTTAVATRLLVVGERTGRMGEMMDRIASFHDEEMARWVEWFTKLFEPLLMAVIGIVIGAIVVLMYFPIFELAGSIQ
jgi:general secretion pathway protein F